MIVRALCPNKQVFVTRQIPQAGLDALLPHVQMEVWSERQPPAYSVLLEKVKQIDGLLCLLTDSIDRAVIEAGSSLKVISQMAVGYDNIDIAAATSRGIPVGNTPSDCNPSYWQCQRTNSLQNGLDGC